MGQKKGHITLESTREKLRIAMTGRKVYWADKISKALKGKKCPWARKNSQVFKKGMTPWNKGIFGVVLKD